MYIYIYDMLNGSTAMHRHIQYIILTVSIMTEISNVEPIGVISE